MFKHTDINTNLLCNWFIIRFGICSRDVNLGGGRRLINSYRNVERRRPKKLETHSDNAKHGTFTYIRCTIHKYAIPELSSDSDEDAAGFAFFGVGFFVGAAFFLLDPLYKQQQKNNTISALVFNPRNDYTWWWILPVIYRTRYKCTNNPPSPNNQYTFLADALPDDLATWVLDFSIYGCFSSSVKAFHISPSFFWQSPKVNSGSYHTCE